MQAPKPLCLPSPRARGKGFVKKAKFQHISQAIREQEKRSLS